MISSVKKYLIPSLFLFGFVTLQSTAQTTFADNFTTQQYNRNDGTGTWASNWTETNDDGSPVFGDAFIFLGTVGTLTNTLAFVGGTGHGINRTVNLTGASSASVTFDWLTNGLDTFAGGQEELGIFISNNNGASFTQIGSGTMVGTNSGTFTQDISGFISANTVFRLQVIGGNETFEGGEFVVIDNLVITAFFGTAITIDDVSVDENAGSATFTVTHIGPDTAGPFTVNFTTTNNTATPGVGNDYLTNSGVLNFSGTSGDSDTITISILDDIAVEGDETFFIDFTATSDPSVNITDQGVGTIVDIEVENSRPYEERIQLNVRGNFEMIGNSNLTCTSNCASPATNNPPVVMGNASIDVTTINSSSADLTLPAGATVAWAGLYWGGSYSSNQPNIIAADPSLNLQQVRLREPGSGTYTTINAGLTNTETTNFGATWNAFMSFADITSIVQSAGSGTYTVADISLITGSGFTGPFGGWTMVIVYEDPGDITRSVSIWDGFDFFGFGANDSFTVTGLLTPSGGVFDTDVGYFAMDGEADLTGDFVSVNGTAVSNVLNPADNTLNSTISKFGVDVGGRNPNQAFNWGIDIDIFDATGLVPNNATTLGVDLGSLNEGIWGGVFAVSNEVAFPAVASKNFSPSTISLGNESTVTIIIENPLTGVDLTNLTLTDNLPSGMIISTSPDGISSCGGTITAVPGSDTFQISGVNLPVGNSCTFTFDVIGTTMGSLDNTISTNDITNDQDVPLGGSSTGTLTVVAGTVVTNRRITYRVKQN